MLHCLKSPLGKGIGIYIKRLMLAWMLIGKVLYLVTDLHLDNIKWINQLSKNLKMLGDTGINILQHPVRRNIVVFCWEHLGNQVWVHNVCTHMHFDVKENTFTSTGIRIRNWFGSNTILRVNKPTLPKP